MNPLIPGAQPVDPQVIFAMIQQQVRDMNDDEFKEVASLAFNLLNSEIQRRGLTNGVQE